MIISASRRTDIPAFYHRWFYKRISEGFVMVRNPYNYHAVSKISLKAEDVSGIVFWSKNPKPMLPELDILKDFAYYFLYTLNSYNKDLEGNIPERKDRIETFKKLADKIGSDRVIWRYDPIIFMPEYSCDFHQREFNYLCNKLENYTKKCIVSFLEPYKKTLKNIKDLDVRFPHYEEKQKLIIEMAKVAEQKGIKLEICSQNLDLENFGITRARCIDNELLSRISGKKIVSSKDRNQRQECKCIDSTDIGVYNTCMHNCRYCYANTSQAQVEKNIRKHQLFSCLMIGTINPDDIIKDKEYKLTFDKQITFDFEN